MEQVRTSVAEAVEAAKMEAAMEAKRAVAQAEARAAEAEAKAEEKVAAAVAATSRQFAEERRLAVGAAALAARGNVGDASQFLEDFDVVFQEVREKAEKEKEQLLADMEREHEAEMERARATAHLERERLLEAAEKAAMEMAVSAVAVVTREGVQRSAKGVLSAGLVKGRTLRRMIAAEQ
eukprot:2094538-Pleurochrysis_carterae.AAC.1